MRANPLITALAGLLLTAPLLIPSVSFAQQKTPSGNAQQTSAQAETAQPAQESSGSFIPLTQLPGIQDAANSATLPAFLNQLYKICVGAGAVLAVIMIMIAGFEFMTSRGSVASNQKAKERIQNAILGLVLVLSPTIVFGIINPSILSLDFTSSLQKLQDVRKLDSIDTTTGQLNGGQKALWTNTNGDRAADTRRCQVSGGKIIFGCEAKNHTGGTRIVSASEACASNEDTFSQCNAEKGTVPTTQQQCTDQYTNITSIPITQTNACNSNIGAVAIPTGCCSGSGVGSLCCAIPKNYVRPSGEVDPGTFTTQYYAWSVGFHSSRSGEDRYVNSSGRFASSQECQANLSSVTSSLSVSGETRSDFPFAPRCLCDQPTSKYPNCPVK